MPRRDGVTLLECLVAIFVMGIGLLALLTLFPIGALRMALAIQNERCYQLGASGTAITTLKGLPNDSSVVGLYSNPGIAGVNNALPDSPSYPVFIDPVGYRCAFGTGSQSLVGGGTPGGPAAIGRSTVSFVGNNQAAYQWFTLLDDIAFENAIPGPGPNGSMPGEPQFIIPVPPNAKQFYREIRYSYAVMCQRPRSSDPTVVDVNIVVYNKRPLSMTAGLTLQEYVYNNSAFNVAGSTVQVSYGGGQVPPPVRVGDWVLDATPIKDAANNVVSAHAYFYRVVGVTDVGGSTIEIETETPLRGFAANQIGTIVVLDGVAEVYQRGTIRLQ